LVINALKLTCFGVSLV